MSNVSWGFTLIELLVVLAVMSLLLMFFTMNIYTQRAERDLKIAQNELSSNLRKVQSYSLAARLLPNGQAPNYYVIRLNLSQPDRYTIQGIYDIFNNPKLVDVETIYLPKDITISEVIVTRSSDLIPSSFTMNGSLRPDSCALLAFKLPFGKMYANSIGFAGDITGDCNVTAPMNITSADRYFDFLKFVINTNITTVSTDFEMVLTIKNNRANLSKQIRVLGTTGNITSL